MPPAFYTLAVTFGIGVEKNPYNFLIQCSHRVSLPKTFIERTLPV